MSQTGTIPRCRHLCLPRRGHSLEECQDAAATAPELGRFAIADGASESAHAALWARLLVDGFVGNPANDLAWADWLPPLQQRWASAIERRPDQPPLPWFLEPSEQQGAFATFLGLVVRPTATGWSWEALAVGDSCLFQVRAGRLIRSFPLVRSSDFGSTPWLLGARTPPVVRSERCAGEAMAEDHFWLMTDALAQWFLRQVETAGRPWEMLEWLLHNPHCEQLTREWLAELRRMRQLRDDDVALMEVIVR